MKRKFALGALLLCAALAAASVDSYLLRRKAHVGDEMHFTEKVTLKGDEDATLEITSALTEKITKVDDDGSVTSKSTDKTLRVKDSKGEDKDVSNEQEEPSSSIATTDVHGITTEYKDVEGSDETDSPTHLRVSNVSDLIFPDDKVKVGDKWSHEFTASTKLKYPASKISYEVLGEEEYQGKPCLKVKFSGKETEGDKPFEANGTLLVRIEDGVTVSYEAELKNFPLSDEDQVDAHVTVTLDAPK